MLLASFEPKIFQLLVDTLSSIKSESNNYNTNETGFLADLFSLFLPELNTENILNIIIVFSGSYLVLIICKAILEYFINLFYATISAKTMKELRDQLFQHIQLLPFKDFFKFSKGSLIQRSTHDINNYNAFILGGLRQTFHTIGILFFTIIMIFFINMFLGIVMISFAALSIFINYIYYQKDQVICRKHETKLDLLNSYTQEALQGVRITKAFANEDFTQAKFNVLNNAETDIGLNKVKLQAKYLQLLDIVILSQLVTAIFLGGFLAIKNQITIGQFLSCFLYIGMMNFPLRMFNHAFANFGLAKVSVQRMAEVLSYKKENYAENHLSKRLKGEIEFKNVSFKYPGQNEYVLKNASFSISAGERVAITGPIGSGKSTIIKLLLRFFEPTSGEILLDNKNISEYPKAYLRTNIGVCLQNSIVLSDSLLNNVKIAKTNATLQEVYRALKDAEVSELIAKLPDGADSWIYEGGANLSGGQKQRISIARTLIREPDIYIFDDATSNIDEINEKKITKTIHKKTENRTSISVTQKLSSIHDADKIIVVENHTLYTARNDLYINEGYLASLNKINMT